MKIDVTQAILAPDRTSIKHNGRDALLRDMLMMGLLNGNAEDSGELKYAKARLAMRIQDNDEIDVPAEDVAMMKKACVILNNWPYMRVCDMLDPPRE